MTLANIGVQLQIVDELLGESPGLSQDVEQRRQENYTAFLKGVEEDEGYRKFDVPTIVNCIPVQRYLGGAHHSQSQVCKSRICTAPCFQAF